MGAHEVNVGRKGEQSASQGNELRGAQVRGGKLRHPRRSVATALDLRAWIAAMFATFGLMLACYGAFFVTEADLAKAGGLNLDLWTGVGMLVAAAAFFMWLMARPPEAEESTLVGT